MTDAPRQRYLTSVGLEDLSIRGFRFKSQVLEPLLTLHPSGCLYQIQYVQLP